jgi:hypothetical protein
MTRYWKTREGKLILYEELEDSHLINILGFLLKNTKETQTRFNQDPIDDNWELEELLPSEFKNLEAEASRRGLDYKKLMKNNLTPAEQMFELFL